MLVVYGIYIQYIVFIRTLSFTFTSALLLTNRSAISVCPSLAAHIRAVSPPYINIYIYIYIRTKTYDIDIVKEVSIHNTSYTIITISVWLAYLDIRYEQIKYIVVCIQTIYIIFIKNNI